MMTEMTDTTYKERFLRTIAFEKTDRPIRMETLGFWNETLSRWHAEGLPPEITDEVSAYLYFGFDLQIPLQIGVHLHPGFDPPFDEEILDENDQNENMLVKRDVSGSVVMVPKDGASTIPKVLKPPVKTIEDWNKIKERLDPSTPGRLALLEPLLSIEGASDWPLCVYIPGLFGTLRHLLGLERLCISYRKDPELILKISRHWVYLWKRVIARICERRRPELVSLWEDMCYLNGPMIGPTTFKRFMLPFYEELISFCRKEMAIPAAGVDTDGNLTILIPLFIKAGINMIYPFEVQAGMDILEVRRQYPYEFVIWGGIDKRLLEKTKEEIEKEIRRIVPSMLERGGYIPAIDHSAHPDIPYENWLFFLEVVRHIGENT